LEKFSPGKASRDWRGLARYAAQLAGVALAYFVLAKLGLRLASVNPSATPIWPPTGIALANIPPRSASSPFCRWSGRRCGGVRAIPRASV
jgi:hypothetical protein